MNKKKNLIRDLSYISKLYGSMPEIVQSGGGNVSAKSKDVMLIKSSGIGLSDVSSSRELAKINLKTYPSVEAQIASISDDIAYNNHDIQDGFNANLFKFI